MNGRLLTLADAHAPGARVVLAMSGGVDSGVSAVRLQQAGFEVLGLTMKNYCYGENAATGRSCCSLDAIDDARGVCDRLGIRHLVTSTEEVFGREVYDNFVDEYRAGRTPNPCVRCNSIVRFSTLRNYAATLGADYVATGHYARVFRADTGRLYLARAASRAKDQSYFLSGLSHDDLEGVLFPLGEDEKREVRASARAAGLDIADKEESQDVCFIPNGSLPDFLRGKVPLEPGDVETVSGEVVGRHDGLAAYTVGQRRGLGIAAGRKQYVVRLDVERNVVVLGDDTDLASRTLTFRPAWMDAGALEAASDLRAQIRSRHAAQAVTSVEAGGDRARVEFAEPQRAIAPGQTVALYDGDVVVGAGVIDGSGATAPRAVP